MSDAKESYRDEGCADQELPVTVESDAAKQAAKLLRALSKPRISAPSAHSKVQYGRDYPSKEEPMREKEKKKEKEAKDVE